MLKQGGQWQQVDWQTALEYVANGLKQIKADHGAQSIGTLVSPHSTLEELHLAALLTRELGSDNIDYRLRNAEFDAFEGVALAGHLDRLADASCSAPGRGFEPAQGPSAVRRSASARPCARARR